MSHHRPSWLGRRMADVIECHLLMFAWLLPSVFAGPAIAQELLQNGGFEGGFYFTAHGEIANHWETCYEPSADGIEWSHYQWWAPAGAVQKITNLPAGAEAGIRQVVTGLTPGSIVEFSARAYRRNDAATLWIGIDPTNSLPVSQLPDRLVAFPSAIHNWNYQEVTAAVGPSGTVTVYLWIYQTAEGVASYFNNASLLEVQPAPPISDLAVTQTLSDSVKLTWTAPPTTDRYEVRYDTAPITDTTWSDASVPISQIPPKPAPAGSSEYIWVRGLQPDTQYHFAIVGFDPSDTPSGPSNSPAGTTAPQGSAPYWAWFTKEKLNTWYADTMADAQQADENRGPRAEHPGNSFSWYYGGLDPDCEHQPPLCAMLQIVRDPWLLQFTRELSDHVWEHTITNTNIESGPFVNNGLKVPGWNESHHLGELTWNGVGLIAVDYGNPKWLQRGLEYCELLDFWTGYTGHNAPNGPYRHFRSMWLKADDWDHTDTRPYCLVDTPENRRLTRMAWYVAWRDSNARLASGQLVKDFLYELDVASLAVALKTDLNKPYGVLPGEVRFDNWEIGGYSGQWWKMASSLGGTPGTSSEWWWDWGVGWVAQRDGYFEMIDQSIVSEDPAFMVPVEKTIKHFSVDEAINDIPPQYMFINNDAYFHGPIEPWPDYNDPWGGYQYIINLMYRQYTGDTQFDDPWLGHANVMWQVLPPRGATRYQRMIRSTLEWTTDNADNPAEGWRPWQANGPFYLAWEVTGDKEWLCRALDENMGRVHLEAMYTGIPGVGINRLPDQPITWNNTKDNFAALVLDWDNEHIKWLTYNFDPTDRPTQIWLWSLEPGHYVFRHGPDGDLDDEMDYVAESRMFEYAHRRYPLELTLPSDRMEVFEIIPVECPLAGDDDTDNDGVGDHCDNCPLVANGDQLDSDGNGIGDVCDNCGGDDTDADGVCGSVDNCPEDIWNPLQQDIDGDSVGNPCDTCPDTIGGVTVHPDGCPITVSADFDSDGDVDLLDYSHLQKCQSGAGLPLEDPDCALADLDGDGDVDSSDTNGWFDCLSGSQVPRDLNCEN